MTKTKLYSIQREGDIVTVTLTARIDAPYVNLERTALRHFTNWQKRNYDSLGYQSSEIMRAYTIRRDDEVRYSLAIRLMGLPTETGSLK